MRRESPVFLCIPHSDVSHMRALQGDAQVTSKVIGSDPMSVGKYMAAMLRGLDYQDRRTALHYAYEGMSGQKLASVPLPGLLPDDATVEQINRIKNGWHLMLLSLGTASANTSVGTVVANATAMATGRPFASDPAVAERPNEVMLSKALLELALLGDEEAQAWMDDNDLKGALAASAAESSIGATDDSPVIEDEMKRLTDAYDCYLHNKPMGGDAAHYSNLASFWDEIWNGVKSGAKSAWDNVNGSASNGAGDGAGQADATAHGAGRDEDATDAAGAVTSSLKEAAKAVDDAKKAMEDGNANLVSYREKLRDAALQQARLQWAESILSTPDDVASILAAANPNMSDPGAFLQSMLSTLPAAKTTGNLGTIKALIYALKAAAAKGDGSADTLYSLLSGDPKDIIRQLESAIVDVNEAAMAALVEKQKAARGLRASYDAAEAKVQRTLEDHASSFVENTRRGATSAPDAVSSSSPQPPASRVSGGARDANLVNEIATQAPLTRLTDVTPPRARRPMRHTASPGIRGLK